MYTTFNISILGYISGPTQVGFFTTASKIISIILALFTAFTGVMLPRMSSLLANHEEGQFILLLNKSMSALFVFCFPVIMYFMVFSPDVINLIGGKGYEGAIIPLRILIPVIFIVGYEQILIIQALMPLKKARAIFINSCVGAAVGLFFNFILIPLYGSIGTSMAYLLSELSVLCSALYFMHRYTGHRFPYNDFLRHLIYNIPILLICVLLNYVCKMNFVMKLIFTAVIVGLYAYFNNYYFIKNELFIQLVDNTKNKLWKHQRSA